MKKTVTNLL